MSTFSKSVSVLFISALTLAACATFSPASRIQSQLVDLGLSPARADCWADELSARLDRRDLEAVADFLGGLNQAETPGSTVDALLSIDNSRAAAAIAEAGLTCAFSN